jgi:hypothetical protein
MSRPVRKRSAQAIAVRQSQRAQSVTALLREHGWRERFEGMTPVATDHAWRVRCLEAACDRQLALAEDAGAVLWYLRALLAQELAKGSSE